MLTIADALAYTATIAADYTFHNARFGSEGGVACVIIDLQHNGKPDGDMYVWIENGPNGPYLHGEY